MPKIIHEHKNCIGCGACAAICPDFFEVNEENIAHLKGSGHDGADNEVLEMNEDKPELKDAADSCPVQIIKII